jgi:hypothetical protein
MTLGPRKEHAMKAKPEQQSSVDIERFRIGLAHKLDRLVAEALEAWPTCENTLCRRKQRCASRDRECIARWQESLPPRSPEEIKAGVEDLKLSLDVRLRLGENATPEQFEEAIAREKAARLAAMPPQQADATPPVVEETKLAPETQARIDAAWNEYVAEQRVERDSAREPGPRITQL